MFAPLAMTSGSHLDPLNAQQKEALLLRDVERLTHREIAVRMGVTHHRVSQILATAKHRLRDCAENGEATLCLLPPRVRDFLEWNGLGSPAALREAIESTRLTWDEKRERLRLDGKSPRNIGWRSWQVMCERAGLPRPERQEG